MHDIVIRGWRHYRWDRQRLALGLRADVNLIDFDRLRLHQPELVNDLPPAVVASCSVSMATKLPSSPERKSSRMASTLA